jgi:hypothetical protein
MEAARYFPLLKFGQAAAVNGNGDMLRMMANVVRLG